jgi:hypothetical protein
MTIYDIKERTAKTSPYFFSRDSLKFFGQTMKAFKVHKMTDGRYEISAPMRDRDGRNMGTTVRYFNPVNNELERA